MTTTTHLPTYPPTTHPLGWGEGVYKLVTTLNKARVKQIAFALGTQDKEYIASLFIDKLSRFARNKRTQEYITFAPTLGFVESELRNGSPANFSWFNGYDVRWQTDRGDYKNFEIDYTLVSLNDIIPLTHIEFIEEIVSGKMVSWDY